MPTPGLSKANLVVFAAQSSRSGRRRTCFWKPDGQWDAQELVAVLADRQQVSPGRAPGQCIGGGRARSPPFVVLEGGPGSRVSPLVCPGSPLVPTCAHHVLEASEHPWLPIGVDLWHRTASTELSSPTVWSTGCESSWGSTAAGPGGAGAVHRAEDDLADRPVGHGHSVDALTHGMRTGSLDTCSTDRFSGRKGRVLTSDPG